MESARDGTFSCSRNPLAAEHRMAFYAHISYVVENSLSDLERLVLLQSRVPRNHTEECTVKLGLRCSCGAVRYRQRIVSVEEADISEVVRYEGTKAIIESPYPTFYSRRDLALYFELPFWRIKKILSSAYDKIHESYGYRAYRGI